MALAERAAVAIGHGRWVEAEEFAERALRVASTVRGWMSTPQRARLFLLRPASRSTAAKPSVPTSSSQGRNACDWGSPTRIPPLAVQCRLELARAYQAMADAGGAETMLREIEALLRRQPDLGTLRADVDELRASLKTMHAEAPGASTLTEAELRLLPYLTTHLSFREIGERLYVSHNTVRSQAMAVYRKLNVTSRNGAVERAGALGLLASLPSL